LPVKLLILRPQPGADETADRAIAKGLDPVVAPLFVVRPLDWDPPEPSEIEAVLLTSANAARHAGDRLDAFVGLPCYCVGGATATAARQAGFDDVLTGPSDGAAAVELMAQDGIVHALHLCGREHIDLDHPGIAITRRCVYAADAVEVLPKEAESAISAGAVALLHSPRAASMFAKLTGAAGIAGDTISIAAISEAVAAAAGFGWKTKAAAAAPNDEALLELAAKLCQTGGGEMGTGG
jgi:uroporphyrinogen-III synthase